MQFNIGDEVRVRQYDDIPDDIKQIGLGKSAGKDGVIVDILWSGAKECHVYRIQFEGESRPSRTDFYAGSFDLKSELERATYSYEFDFAENLVIARLYEHIGESKKMIARGHGHIFHDGALGIAQAGSYALKKLYKFLEDENAEN